MTADTASQADDAPRPATLKALTAAEAACTRCPLYRHATQVVPGAGSAGADIMMVGEQPGDQEDRAGEPFVGPAGRLLDKAFREAGIDRRSIFLTNAVKHFKHEMRGKRRIHQRPNAGEIDRCRWWLDLERQIVRPRVIVALGATAGRSLFGRTIVISRMRGRIHSLEDGTPALVTIHPSALLRMRRDAAREERLRGFLQDLRLVRRTAAELNTA